MNYAFLLFLFTISRLPEKMLSQSLEFPSISHLPNLFTNYLIQDYNDSSYLSQNQNQKQNPIDNLAIDLFHSVYNLYNKTLADVEELLEKKCYESLSQVNLDEGFIYLFKFFEATNFFNNDLNSFKKCHDVDKNMISFFKKIRNENVTITKEELKGNLTYLLLYTDMLPEYDKMDIRSKTNTNILGVCIRKNCEEKDYRLFLYKFNENTGGIIYNYTNEKEHTYECFKNSTTLIEIKPEDSNIFELIPVVILGLIMLLTIFPCVLKLFFCCFKKAPKRKTTSNLRSFQQSIGRATGNANNSPSKKSSNNNNNNIDDNVKPSANLFENIIIEDKLIDTANNDKFNFDLEKNNSINENKNNDNNYNNNNNNNNNIYARNTNDFLGKNMIIIDDNENKDFNLENLDNTQNYENEDSEYYEDEEHEQENIDNFYSDNPNSNELNFRHKKSSFLNESQIDYDSIENLIKKLWVRNNFLNFFESENSSNNKNEIGLAAVKGIRGISLILGISGFVYFQIFSSPYKIYNLQCHENMIKYFYISGIIFGLRYTRRVLYAFSGYTLVYKFLYYLDNVIEKRKVNNISKSNVNNADNSNSNNNNDAHRINDFDGSNLNSNNNNDLNNNNGNNNKNNNVSYFYDSTSKTKKKDSSNVYDSKKHQTTSSFTFSDSDYENSYSDSDDSDYTSEASEESDEEGEQTFSTRISEDLKKNLHFSDYFRFVLSQSHKLAITYIFLLFFRFSYFSLKAAFYDPKPLFFKLQRLFEEVTLPQIIGMMTLWPFNDCMYFILGLNEIRFFIVYSFIIFVGYKYRYRIDLVLLFLLILCFLYKIIYFAINNNTMHPALFHYETDETYMNFYVDFLFNNSFFIIGILFGKVNYLIQKGIKTKEKLVKKGKDFLSTALNLATFFSKMKDKKFVCIKAFWISFTLVLNMFFICSYSIFYNILGYDLKTDNLKHMNNNFALKIFYLLDSEFFVFFLMFNFLLIINPGKNVLNYFLSDENWRFFTKPYFTVVTILPLILLDFLHHANYRIRIDMFNMSFYSIIAWTITLFISICVHILVESPMKNFVKFIIPRVK